MAAYNLKLVYPNIIVLPESDAAFISFQASSVAEKASFSFTIAEQNVSDLAFEHALFLIESGFKDIDWDLAITIAASHQVAAKALQDPYFRKDRFETRIEEYLGAIRSLAQEVYDANSEHQQYRPVSEDLR